MTQTSLPSHRRWQAQTLRFKKKRNCTIHGVKTKALINCAGAQQNLLQAKKSNLNLNSLLVTRQMTLFHQGVWMGEKLVSRMHE